MTKTIKLSQPLDVLHLAFGRSNSALKRRTASTCLPATLRPRLPAAHTFCAFSFQVSAAHFRGAFKNIHYIVCVVARLCAQWHWNLSSGGKCDSRDETCTVLKNNVEAFYTSVSVFHNFTTWWRQILYFSLHHIYEITLVTCYFVDYIRTKEEEKKLILKKLKNAEYQSWYQLPISCSQVYSIYIHVHLLPEKYLDMCSSNFRYFKTGYMNNIQVLSSLKGRLSLLTKVMFQPKSLFVSQYDYWIVSTPLINWLVVRWVISQSQFTLFIK